MHKAFITFHIIIHLIFKLTYQTETTTLISRCKELSLKGVKTRISVKCRNCIYK